MNAAPDPLVVTISHRLGRDEAKRRLERGFGAVRGEVARYVRSLDYAWDGYTLNFHAVALMQAITGRIEVLDEFVRIELNLPRLLHLLAKTIAGQIEHRGQALLERPTGKD